MNPFEVLGIEPTTDEKAIYEAYRQKRINAKDAEELWTLNIAYEEAVAFATRRKMFE